MALIKCPECSKEVSDKAVSCPNCGFPIASSIQQKNTNIPTRATYNGDGTFTGTMSLMVKLAMRAVQELGWTLEQANDSLGLVTFQTKISWGSWNGVACSLNIEEVTEYKYRVKGTGKQNMRGGQLIALNIGGEAESKAGKAILKMMELAKIPEPSTKDASIPLMSWIPGFAPPPISVEEERVEE